MNQQHSSTGLYLEDLTVGQRFSSASLTVTAQAIEAFPSEFDPPFHLSEHAAKLTFFAGVAASGWHTAELTMRLNIASSLLLTAKARQPATRREP
jgi:acyl dehydratase